MLPRATTTRTNISSSLPQPAPVAPALAHFTTIMDDTTTPKEQPPPHPVTTNNKKDRCSVRNCKVKGAQKYECGASGCTKTAHLICYTGAIVSKYELTPLPGSLVACCRKCHNNATREVGGVDIVDDDFTGKRGNWDCDGLTGPNDTRTSIRILMDWLLEEGNYNKYCGKNNDGVKKSYWHTILALKMTDETKSTRDATSVKNKIKHLEESFKKAHKFATSETGAGLEEKHGTETFQDMGRKICLYYYEMLPIMQDRAKVKPKVTSYNLFDDDDEEEQEDSNETQDDNNERSSTTSTNSSTDEAELTTPATRTGEGTISTSRRTGVDMLLSELSEDDDEDNEAPVVVSHKRSLEYPSSSASTTTKNKKKTTTTTTSKNNNAKKNTNKEDGNSRANKRRKQKQGSKTRTKSGSPLLADNDVVRVLALVRLMKVTERNSKRWSGTILQWRP